MNVCTCKDIGKIVAVERKRQGLSQTQLAGFCDVGITFISNLENGKGTAEIDKVLNVVLMLGLDISIARRGE